MCGKRIFINKLINIHRKHIQTSAVTLSTLARAIITIYTFEKQQFKVRVRSPDDLQPQPPSSSFQGLTQDSPQCPACGMTRGAWLNHERESVIVRLALVGGSPGWALRGRPGEAYQTRAMSHEAIYRQPVPGNLHEEKAFTFECSPISLVDRKTMLGKWLV